MIRCSKPGRSWLVAPLLALFLGLNGNEARANGEPTLILPFRTTGVSEVTADVSRSLLSGELESRGYEPVHVDDLSRSDCQEMECARSIGRQNGASRIVYGSLSQLGSKIVVRIRSFRTESDSLDYNDQLNAAAVEDLDTLMERVAEGIASGRGTSDHVTVGSVLKDEAEPSRVRRGRRGFGARGGFLFTSGDSYGRADRLTSFSIPYKFERDTFFIETTTLLGIAAGDGTVEWTLLDVYGARFFGVEDTALYLGTGFGIHVVHVEGETIMVGVPPLYPDRLTQTETAPVFDIGGGIAFLRTYDYGLSLDLRYHIVLDDFGKLGGDGAHGLQVSIGTGR